MQQELVHDPQNDHFIERLEAHHCIQPVAELGREQAFDVGHFIAGFPWVGEADRSLVHGFRTGIGRHDNNHVTEVGFTAIVVGQGAVVHHLQQHIEDRRVGFLDFVKQQHTVWLLGNGLGQQTTLVKTHVAGGRANQAAHSVLLHVLAHVKANQVNAHDIGELLGRFRLADAGRTAEQERADRLVALAQARPCHFDGRGQHIERFVLPEHHVLQVPLQGLELAAVIIGDVGWRNTGNLCHNFLNLGLTNDFLAFGRCQDALRCASLVDHVNRLIGQMPVVDVFGAQISSGLQGSHGVFDVVVLLKP